MRIREKQLLILLLNFRHSVSPSGVISIWLRHNPASMKQRLYALEKKSAEEGLVLTEAHVQALERKGEIESSWAMGYLGSRDTFYVGTIKGAGRIYQQTFSVVTQNGRQKSSIPPKLPLLVRICSMTKFCRFLRRRKWV